MRNNKQEQIAQLDGYKPIEEMTTEEKDEYFRSFSGLTYAEWCEKYKNDTLEDILRDMRSEIKTL